MRIRTFLGLLFAVLASVPTFAAASSTAASSEGLMNVVAKLDREAAVDAEGPMVLADLIEKEFGTSRQELEWGVANKMTWGEITALAYIQATIGKSFAEMNQEDARHNLWSYAEKAGMSCEKMARSMEGFLKQAERERNSRIFDRLRASRRVHPLPDLGSGFGLFQEALDFRRIDSPRPTKIHDVPGDLAKGEQ
jgi:hypothetical protein